MSQDFRRASAAIYGTPWAIRDSKLREIVEIFEARKSGAKLPELQEKVRRLRPKAAAGGGGRPERRYQLDGSVAIVPVVGVLSKRVDWFQAISGGMSAETLKSDLQQALNDPDVKSIVLNIDSPGGSVFGPAEVGEVIFGARGTKPIVAVVNEMACSGAYWIASAAETIVLNQTAMVGSVGVYMVHEDWSKAEAEAGVKVTMIAAGRWKVAGNEHEPLSKDGREKMQGIVDEYYRLFVQAVATHRGQTPEQVREQIAEGRDFIGSQAIAVGAADRLGTLGETVGQLKAGTFFQGGKVVGQAAVVPAAEAKVEPAIEDVTKPEKVEAGAKITPAEPAKVEPDAAAISAEAAKAERQRIADINALLDIARIPAAESASIRKTLIDGGCDLATARQTVTEAVRRQDGALGDAGGAGTPNSETPDPDAKVKAAYAKSRAIFEEKGITEAAYIREMKAIENNEALACM